MAHRTAFVTGITGQDGSYLAELLLERGYRVVGIVRREPRDAQSSLPPGLAGSVDLVEWDMRDLPRLVRLLEERGPLEFYNCAAHASGSGMYDEPIEIGEINGVGVTRILEAIRRVDAGIRFCQASSSEIFASASESPQSETTPVCPRSPYGAAKAYADFMIRIYRERHGLFACSAILFNHESPRRSTAFVTRKITHELARIKRGLAGELRLGNLSARRDWGFAGDHVRAMWLILQQPRAEDFVVATGKTHSVREFCESAFTHAGLDYRDYVKEDSVAYRPDEPVQLVGNSAKADRLLGWKPETGFQGLVKMMVDADLRTVRG
ncbi:MAG TPA: GDP-mannose 4,6-dehydratase [Burkholderiales bacterium]|nr:GDP-mannose 4,6-dehydratase [Burkholderiales bacterium]